MGESANISILDQLTPELRSAFAQMFELLAAIEAKLSARNVTADVLTAPELARRWNIPADGGNALQRLARRCAARGLMAMEGTRGWNAVYRLCDVLRAEENAVGAVAAGSTLSKKSRR